MLPTLAAPRTASAWAININSSSNQQQVLRQVSARLLARMETLVGSSTQQQQATVVASLAELHVRCRSIEVRLLFNFKIKIGRSVEFSLADGKMSLIRIVFCQPLALYSSQTLHKI